MTLADAEHLAVLLAATMFLLTVVGTAVLIVRLRRRWRRRQGVFAWVRREGLASGISWAGGAIAGSVASPSWWLVQRDRHGMWRAVTAARRAVTVSARAGAPVGDLPVLVRRLQRSARQVDAALRASGGDRGLVRSVTRERTRIEATARDIQAAAMRSFTATHADVEPVVSAVAVEVTALAEGVRSARSVRLPAR